MLTKIDGLAYEVNGDSVLIEQDDQCGNVDRVFLHRVVLAHLSGEMGIFTKREDSPVHRELRTLRRRLRVAAERAGRLDCMLQQCGSHEDLSLEQALSSATAGLLDDWMQELDDAGEPDAASPPSDGADPRIEPASSATPKPSRNPDQTQRVIDVRQADLLAEVES